jgi:hypothetical protein
MLSRAPFFRAPIKIMLSSRKPGSALGKKLGFHFIMKTSGRDGKGEWRYPNRWGCTASDIAAASTAKKNVF